MSDGAPPHPPPASGSALAPAPRWLRSVKQSIRGVTLTHLAVAPSDPQVMYASSANGFVFATHDGGVNWIETRLHVQRRLFPGTLRGQQAVTGLPNVLGAIGGVKQFGFLRDSLGDLFQFPYGTTGEPYLEFTPDSPAFWPAPRPPGLPRVGDLDLRDSSGRLGGGQELRLAKGRAAWRLVYMLASRRKFIPSMNLFKTLSTRADAPTDVTMIAVHPRDPKRAFAGTLSGLFATRDGGDSWDLVYPGSNAWDRRIYFLAFEPTSPHRLWLGTGQGVLTTAEGLRYEAVSGAPFSSADILAFEWAPTDPRQMWVGSNWGGFRSRDGGQTWSWAFLESLPQANTVRSVAVSPRDPGRVVIGTDDGMYGTRDGGESWNRVGGLIFTGLSTRRVVADPHRPGHWVAITWTDVWESYDDGETWAMVYVQNSDWWMRWLDIDRADPDLLWVITSNEIFQLTSRPPMAPDPDGLARLRAFLLGEPTMSEAIDAAFRQFELRVDTRMDIRRRARAAAWLPHLTAFAGYMEVDSFAFLGAVFLESPSQSPNVDGSPFPKQDLAAKYGDRANATFDRDPIRRMPYAGAMLSWNLWNTVFRWEEMPWGRMMRVEESERYELKIEVQRLYEERSRKLVDHFSMPPADLPSRIALRLRLEELTHHLDLLTGGLFAPSVAWLDGLPEPWETTP